MLSLVAAPARRQVVKAVAAIRVPRNNARGPLCGLPLERIDDVMVFSLQAVVWIRLWTERCALIWSRLRCNFDIVMPIAAL